MGYQSLFNECYRLVNLSSTITWEHHFLIFLFRWSSFSNFRFCLLLVSFSLPFLVDGSVAVPGQQRLYSKTIVDNIKNKPIWLSDISTYPVIFVCGFACTLAAGYSKFFLTIIDDEEREERQPLIWDSYSFCQYHHCLTLLTLYDSFMPSIQFFDFPYSHLEDGYPP